MWTEPLVTESWVLLPVQNVVLSEENEVKNENLGFSQMRRGGGSYGSPWQWKNPVSEAVPLGTAGSKTESELAWLSGLKVELPGTAPS